MKTVQDFNEFFERAGDDAANEYLTAQTLGSESITRTCTHETPDDDLYIEFWDDPESEMFIVCLIAKSNTPRPCVSCKVQAHGACVSGRSLLFTVYKTELNSDSAIAEKIKEGVIEACKRIFSDKLKELEG